MIAEEKNDSKEQMTQIDSEQQLQEEKKAADDSDLEGDMDAAERTSADETAKRARAVMQRRYNRSGIVLEEGNAVNVVLIKQHMSKLDMPRVAGIVVKVHHRHLYSVFTMHGVISEKLDVSCLAVARHASVELKAKLAACADWKKEKKVSLADLSKLKGGGSLRCGCGKNREDPNTPIICGKHCKCVKNGVVCGSQCHKGAHCNHKH